MLELTCNNIGEENEHAEPSLLAILDSLAQSKKIRRLDASFARFLKQQGADDKIACLGAVTSFALGQGHSCFPLAWLTKESLLGRELCQLVGDVLLPFDLEPDQHFISTGEIASPLVIEHHSVYLYRYYHYERTLAQRLLALTANIDVDLSKLHRDLDQIFPTVDASTETDWQKLAAYVALTHQLAVISGGPGTGKTTTVIKLLALLIGQLGSSDEPIIKLTAPTGKAAARLSESISAALVRMNLPQPLQQAIPSEASTLHRLLGVIPNSHEFRHNASNPLHLDVLVVDEASMVDLPLMSRLLDALPPNARLIFLGDRDQLASVEAGSVLADMCIGAKDCAYSPAQVSALDSLCVGTPVTDVKQAAERQPSSSLTKTKLTDSVAFLRKSYRFDENSGIGVLAGAVNRGDVAAIKNSLQKGFADITHLKVTGAEYDDLMTYCSRAYKTFLDEIKHGASPALALKRFSSVQLLCALREGPYGVTGLNTAITDKLRAARLIDGQNLWYPGRPVIVTRNEPSLDLYNGDIGIALPVAEEGQSGEHGGQPSFKVWFETRDGVKGVLASRLPEHETAFAMTIHKSQGSEFEQVLMVLPPNDSPVLTRELVYTGITRAKKSLMLIADLEMIMRSATRLTERASNLAARLGKA